MNILGLSTIIATLANIIIGILVVIKNPKNRTNQLFSILCLFLALLLIGTYLSLTVLGGDKMLFWIRFVMAFATIQAITLLLFFYTFPGKEIRIIKARLFLIIIVGLITFILCFTPYVFSKLNQVNPEGVSTPVAAPGMILFTIVTLGALFYAIYIAIRKYLTSNGIIKLQLGFILLGLVIMYLGILLFSFAFVVILHNANFVFLTSLFTIPFIVLTSYVILRFRFMDIRVVVRRSLIYGVSLLLTLAVYTYFALMVKDSIEKSWNINPSWTAVILIALVALGFPPLKNLVEKSINTLFKGKKSIDLAVKEVQDKMSQQKDFSALIRIVAGEITNTIGIKEVSLYILSHRNRQFEYESAEGDRRIIKTDNPLVQYFQQRQGVIVLDEIPHLLERENEQIERDVLNKVEKEMKKLGASLVLPLKTEVETFCLVVLGKQAENKAYTVEDIDFLERLRDQVSSTLAYALLYSDAMARIQPNF